MATTVFNLGGGKLKIKDVIYGTFLSGNWTGTVSGTIPVDGTLIMVRIFTHGSQERETLTVGGQARPKWSTNLSKFNFSDMNWWAYMFQPTKVRAGDKFVLNRPEASGSSAERNGLYYGIIV